MINTSGKTESRTDAGENHNGPVIAIDIGGSKLVAGLVNPDGEILYSQKYPWTELTSAGVIRDIKAAVHKALSENPQCRPVAMGAAIPGLADPEKGIWIESSFSGIRDLPFASVMKEEFGLPVFIENDCNACAVAEKLFGRCKNTDHFIWMTVSNGIGGCIFVNGRLYTGSCGNAGEIGHVVVEEGPSARLCKCGLSGCAEMQASGPSLAKNYQALGGKSEIDGEPPSAKTIAGLAHAGDRTALETFEMEGLYLGRAIGAAINLLNPQKVIIGGGVSLAFDLFRPSLEKNLKTHVYQNANPGYTVEPTALGYNAGLLGAAALCFV